MGAGRASRIGRRALVLAACALAACAQPAQAAGALRLRSGGQPLTIEGRFTEARQQRVFTFEAQAGDHLRIELKGAGALHGVLIAPSGAQDGGPGGVVYDGPVTESGTYRLRVSPSTMGEAWSGPFQVRLWRRGP